jgi:hypothetical protein
LVLSCTSRYFFVLQKYRSHCFSPLGGVLLTNGLTGYKGGRKSRDACNKLNVLIVLILFIDYSTNFMRKSKWSLPRNDLMNRGNPSLVGNYEACASLCYWHGQCYSFTWNSVTGMCFLLKSFKPDSGNSHAEEESGIWGNWLSFNFLSSINLSFRSF